MRASPLTEQIPAPRDRLGRLEVNEELRVPQVPTVFAAGDVAAALLWPGQPVLQSCQHAIPLGKYAGHNAAADLLGLPVAAFATSRYVTCLDLGSSGALFTTGFERSIALSGAEGKARKQTINQKWIYPPLDDPAEILRVADYRVGTRDTVAVRPSSAAELRGKRFAYSDGPVQPGEVTAKRASD